MKKRVIRRAAPSLLVWLLLSATALVVVWRSGAFSRGLTGFSDESSHYVTSVALKAYLLNGSGRDPVQFLEDYYLHYPMIAIGKWPPAYYIFASIWALLFGHSIPSFLVFNVLISAATGVLLFAVLQGMTGSPAAFAAALVWLLVPANQWSYSRVMADCLLSLFALGAVLSLARYLTEPRRLWLAAYVACTVLAILTKGSGFAALALPFLASLIAWRRDWLLDWRLQLAPAAALALVVPWHLYVWRLLPIGTRPGGLSAANVLLQFTELLAGLPRWLGPLTVVFAVAGLWLLFSGSLGKELTHRAPFWALQLAALISYLGIYIVAPMGMEPRRTLMAAPAIAALAVLPARWPMLRGRPLLSGCLLLAVAAPLFFPPDWTRKPEGPWREFVRSGMLPRIADGSAVLVAGRVAEGAIISEYAQVQLVPRAYLLRASKHLVESDWLGEDYEVRIPDPSALEKFLREVPVNWIVFESGFPGIFRSVPDSAHLDVVRAFLQQRNGGWVRVFSMQAPPGSPHPGTIELYQRQAPITAPLRLEVDMTRSLGKVLRREAR